MYSYTLLSLWTNQQGIFGSAVMWVCLRILKQYRTILLTQFPTTFWWMLQKLSHFWDIAILLSTTFLESFPKSRYSSPPPYWRFLDLNQLEDWLKQRQRLHLRIVAMQRHLPLATSQWVSWSEKKIIKMDVFLRKKHKIRWFKFVKLERFRETSATKTRLNHQQLLPPMK